MEKIPLLRRFIRRRKSKLESPPPNTIAVGSRLPNVNVEMLTTSPTNDGEPEWKSLSLLDAMGDGMSILVVGMPSTKTCASIHLPGYMEASPRLEMLGIRKIAIVTSKASFMNQEFIVTTSSSNGGRSGRNGTTLEETKTPLVVQEQQLSRTEITLLACTANGAGDANLLIKTLGFTKEMGFGIKSNRFVLVLKDGIVNKVLREEGVDDCTAVSALRIVECLTSTLLPNSLETNPQAAAIEIDYRVIIGAGAILTIFLYTLLASILMEYNVANLPSLFRFDLSWLFHFSSAQDATDSTTPFTFQLLKEHL
jgi:peroxiredoxin